MSNNLKKRIEKLEKKIKEREKPIIQMPRIIFEILKQNKEDIKQDINLLVLLSFAQEQESNEIRFTMEEYCDRWEDIKGDKYMIKIV